MIIFAVCFNYRNGVKMKEHLPDIYLFNPTCEYAVANGNASWQPNRLLQKMESDLAVLPLYLAQPGDYVLIDVAPSEEFLSRLKELNVHLPEFITKKVALQRERFLKIPKGKLLPWGWSPAAHRLLAPLKTSCSTAFLASPVSIWKPEYRELYSKKFAWEIRKEISNQIDPKIMISPELHPEICTTQSEIEYLLSRWQKLMIKAPWSSSGRGLQPITKIPVHPKVWEKLLGMVQEQGYVMVEPFLDKTLDMALQFELNKGKATYLGISRFAADKKGQYQGNFLNGFPHSANIEVKTFARSLPEKIVAPLVSAIEKSKLASWYEGFFGVDLLVFRNEDNQLKVNPCLEINVRQNMGLLSLQLEKLLIPEKKGMFRTFYQPGKTYFTFKKEMETKYPLQLSQNKIEAGFFSLTEANEDTLFGAYILV